MPDGRDAITVKTLTSIHEAKPTEWNCCAGSGNPFVSHAFLAALEDSKSVNGQAGWLPQHLIIEEPDGGLAACAPLYVKSHSYGEYVFDWAWADAYHRAGGRYYPKLLCAVPFTPATGPRLLVNPQAKEPKALKQALAGAMAQLAEQIGASSVHLNFLEKPDWELLGEMGFLQRTGHQYHWHNDGYQSFDDFLEALTSRKRKTIRKERRETAQHGIALKTLTGSDLEERHWDAFFKFYMDTSSRKWGEPYLTRDFFFKVGETMAEKVVLVAAERDNETVAAALNFTGDETLFGRYWGCTEDYRFLHFEACYYRAIDYAIEHGLRRVEAGAQGEHKIQRGYLPTHTYSAHWLFDPNFKRAVDRFLTDERQGIDQDIRILMTHSPFKNQQDS